MDIIEKIEDFEGQDEVIFNRMLTMIVNLDPDKLTEEQLQDIIDIIDGVELLGGEADGEELEERKAYKRAKKSNATTKQYARNYYGKNKISLEKRKRKIENSADGKKRKRNKKRMAAQGKSPSGRQKLNYNTKNHVNK